MYGTVMNNTVLYIRARVRVQDRTRILHFSTEPNPNPEIRTFQNPNRTRTLESGIVPNPNRTRTLKKNIQEPY